MVLTAGDDLELPKDARVVIALGGRAARERYPSRAALITALSPGYEARARAGAGPVARVRMTLAPDEFARRLLALRPGAKSAVLLWSQPCSGRFAEEVRADAASLGLAVTPVRVVDPGDVPGVLRALPRADALWLSPDSGLVTPTAFDAVCEYSRSAGVPFFAPAPALAARCGIAGLAPDFRASGLRAGAAAREALAGQVLPEDLYPPAAASDAMTEVLASTRTRAGR